MTCQMMKYPRDTTMTIVVVVVVVFGLMLAAISFSIFSNATSYAVSYNLPPTRFTHRWEQPSSQAILEDMERFEQHRNVKTHSDLALEGQAEIPYDPDQGGVKRRKKRKKRNAVKPPVKEAACGEDVTLQCSAPSPDSVDGLEWIRTDLDQYVFLYRDGKPDLTNQHQAYRGRTELWKGTADLELKNVTATDSGTYECRFIDQSPGVSKRSIISSDPVSVVNLRVTQAGECTRVKEKEDDVPNDEVSKSHHYVTIVVVVVVVVVVVFGLMLAAISFSIFCK